MMDSLEVKFKAAKLECDRALTATSTEGSDVFVCGAAGSSD